jgi:PP-loop superfamily ATP-utilizing enzyme
MLLVAKIDSIKTLLSSFESVLVALSGGVDSSVLLKLAADCLGRPG